MNTTIFENKKCPTCGELLSTKNLPVVESKIIPGSYLLGCEKCMSTAMTAGSHIVKVPEDRTDIEREYTKALNQATIDRIGQSKLGKTPGGLLLQGILKEVQNAMDNKPTEKANKSKAPAEIPGRNCELTFKVSDLKEGALDKLTDRRISTFNKPKDYQRIEVPLQPAQPKTSPIVEKEIQDGTAYVVLDKDGDVIDEYRMCPELSEKENIKHIVNEMIEDYGEEKIANEELTLHKLEKVDIKFKKKISYELDM